MSFYNTDPNISPNIYADVKAAPTPSLGDMLSSGYDWATKGSEYPYKMSDFGKSLMTKQPGGMGSPLEAMLMASNVLNTWGGNNPQLATANKFLGSALSGQQMNPIAKRFIGENPDVTPTTRQPIEEHHSVKRIFSEPPAAASAPVTPAPAAGADINNPDAQQTSFLQRAYTDMQNKRSFQSGPTDESGTVVPTFATTQALPTPSVPSQVASEVAGIPPVDITKSPDYLKNLSIGEEIARISLVDPERADKLMTAWMAHLPPMQQAIALREAERIKAAMLPVELEHKRADTALKRQEVLHKAQETYNLTEAGRREYMRGEHYGKGLGDVLALDNRAKAFDDKPIPKDYFKIFKIPPGVKTVGDAIRIGIWDTMQTNATHIDVAKIHAASRTGAAKITAASNEKIASNITAANSLIHTIESTTYDPTGMTPSQVSLAIMSKKNARSPQEQKDLDAAYRLARKSIEASKFYSEEDKTPTPQKPAAGAPGTKPRTGPRAEGAPAPTKIDLSEGAKGNAPEEVTIPLQGGKTVTIKKGQGYEVKNGRLYLDK